jgi:hypothetical protein
MFARDLSISMHCSESQMRSWLQHLRYGSGSFGVDMALDLGVSWQDVVIIRLVNSMDVPMRIMDIMFPFRRMVRKVRKIDAVLWKRR